MMRESITEDALKLGAYLNYYSSLGQDDENLKLTQEENILLTQASGVNWNQPNDTVSITISAVTGFLDGSFHATNISGCRTGLNKMTRSFGNMTLAMAR
jgi:hypothetical protein